MRQYSYHHFFFSALCVHVRRSCSYNFINNSFQIMISMLPANVVPTSPYLAVVYELYRKSLLLATVLINSFNLHRSIIRIFFSIIDCQLQIILIQCLLKVSWKVKGEELIAHLISNDQKNVGKSFSFLVDFGYFQSCKAKVNTKGVLNLAQCF